MINFPQTAAPSGVSPYEYEATSPSLTGGRVVSRVFTTGVVGYLQQSIAVGSPLPIRVDEDLELVEGTFDSQAVGTNLFAGRSLGGVPTVQDAAVASTLAIWPWTVSQR